MGEGKGRGREGKGYVEGEERKGEERIRSVAILCGMAWAWQFIKQAINRSINREGRNVGRDGREGCSS